MQELMSLYDYLGKPAGKVLGAEIYKIAKAARTKVSIREVSNPKYKGKVMLYTRDFLDSYFTNNENIRKRP
jgi:hypothetical protein